MNYFRRLIALLVFSWLCSCAWHTDMFPKEINKKVYYDSSAVELIVFFDGCTIDDKARCMGEVSIAITAYDQNIMEYRLDSLEVDYETEIHDMIGDSVHKTNFRHHPEYEDQWVGLINVSQEVPIPRSMEDKRAVIRVRGYFTRSDTAATERAGVDVEFLIKTDSGFPTANAVPPRRSKAAWLASSQ